MDLAVLNLVVRSRTLSVANRRLFLFRRLAHGADGAASAFNRSLLVLAAGFGILGAAAVKQFATIEKLEITLRTLIGSAEETAVVMADLRALSAETPIAFKQLAESTALLKAFGTETKDLIPDLIALSDAAAGLGGSAPNVALERFVRNLGEIRSQGKLDNEDLRRLAELRIPNLLEELNTIFGTKDVFSFRKAVEQGRVGSEDAIKAIFDILRRSTGGLNKEIAKTVSGAFQVLLNNIALEMEALGKAINRSLDLRGLFEDAIPVVKEYFTIVRQTVQLLGRSGITGDLDKRAVELADTLRTLADVVKTLIGLKIVLWIKNATIALTAFTVAVLKNPFLILATAAVRLSFKLGDLAKAFRDLKQAQNQLELTPGEIFDRRQANFLEDTRNELLLLVRSRNVPDAQLREIRDALREVEALDPMQDPEGFRGAIPDFAKAKADVEALLVAMRKLEILFSPGDETLAPLRFGLRPKDRTAEFDRLKEDEREILQELRTVHMKAFDKEISDTEFHFDELNKLWVGDARARLVIARAREAALTLVEEEELKRRRGLLVEGGDDLTTRLKALNVERQSLGLSEQGADRLTFQIEAQAEAMKAFGGDAEAAARAVAEIMAQFDELADASRLAQVFDNLEVGIKNAVTSGLEAAIFDESWQEALMAAFRQIASNALGSVVDGLSDVLLGKTGGNQNNLFGALGGLFGGGGGPSSGPELGTVIETPGFTTPAAPGKQGNVLVTMVPDVATADAVLAKASSQGLSTAFAAGAGRGGIKAGRIKAGRR